MGSTSSQQELLRWVSLSGVSHVYAAAAAAAAAVDGQLLNWFASVNTQPL